MKYLILLVLLFSCSKKERPTLISMTEISNLCIEIGVDLGAHNAKATAWYNEDNDTYEPDCALDFKMTDSSYRILHLNEIELKAINIYKINKR